MISSAIKIVSLHKNGIMTTLALGNDPANLSRLQSISNK
jgi:hypothetical protein